MSSAQEFLDVRNHGFFRVGVLIPGVHLGDPVSNAHEHMEGLQQLYSQGAQYVLCPELSLTGYTNGDLFHQEILLKAAREAIARLLDWSGDHAMIFSVGAPLRVNGMLFNCAITFARGQILCVAPKTYPPEYREFYELRHFARAPEARVTEIDLPRSMDREIPFGNDILIQCSEDFVLHTEVCEDLWVPIPPSAKAALAGATVLANLSASNITINKSPYRQMLAESSSSKNIAVQMYAAAGYGESTTDLAWDGDGYIVDRGILVARTERFTKNGTSILADVDLAALQLERQRQSSFHQNAADNPSHFRHFWCFGGFRPPTEDSAVGELRRFIDPHPFVPSDLNVRDTRCRETFMIQATSLVRRLEALPDAMRKVVIGVSGGQDSTHALLVAAKAMDLMRQSRTNIIAITMPGFGTTQRTYQNARRLIEAVGATFEEHSVKPVATELFVATGYDPATDEGEALVFENDQSWGRKAIELSLACHKGAIVLGTGDLSELILGWCTMYGDHASHYGINAGVPKTMITYLIRWSSDVVFKDEPQVQECLKDILETPVSPELKKPAADGTIAQKTEERIGPYELHDFTAYNLIRFGFSPSKICRMALHAFGGKYNIGEIKRWMQVFLVRFFATQVKRSVLPDGPKVGLLGVSPRGDWRMPSDALPNVWLADLDRVPDSLE